MFWVCVWDKVCVRAAFSTCCCRVFTCTSLCVDGDGVAVVVVYLCVYMSADDTSALIIVYTPLYMHDWSTHFSLQKPQIQPALQIEEVHVLKGSKKDTVYRLRWCSNQSQNEFYPVIQSRDRSAFSTVIPSWIIFTSHIQPQEITFRHTGSYSLLLTTPLDPSWFVLWSHGGHQVQQSLCMVV